MITMVLQLVGYMACLVCFSLQNSICYYGNSWSYSCNPALWVLTSICVEPIPEMYILFYPIQGCHRGKKVPVVTWDVAIQQSFVTPQHQA